MSWNEPGGGGNKPKDPWGGGDNNGPPDLDEALKKLQETPRRSVWRRWLIIRGRVWTCFFGRCHWYFVAGCGRDMGRMGLYQVDQQERGVVLRFGKYYELVGPGLHWNPPLDRRCHPAECYKGTFGQFQGNYADPGREHR